METRDSFVLIPVTTGQSLVWINLAGIARGTLQLLGWATAICLVLCFGLLLGMMHGAKRGRRGL